MVEIVQKPMAVKPMQPIVTGANGEQTGMYDGHVNGAKNRVNGVNGTNGYNRVSELLTPARASVDG
jgi:hypothetical protein